MGRPPCCDKTNVKRGLWTAEEDAKILAHVSSHGIGNWTLVPKRAGLNRCGKSCRLRWTNYLRPDLKHDTFTPQEEDHIIKLHKAIGSRWSLIAQQLPGRTDNDVKNYWNTKLRKKLAKMGIDPVTHKPFSQILSDYGNISTGLQTTSSTVTRIGSLSKLSTSSHNNYNNNNNVSIQITEPMKDHFQNTSSFLTNNHHSWPYFYNEVPSPSSSSSSSSSCTVNRLSSPQPYLSQPSPFQVTPPVPAPFSPPPSTFFSWSDFLVGEPAAAVKFSTDMQLIKKQELPPLPPCNFTSETNSHFEAAASSTSVKSFVEAILDKDSQMQAEFSHLLDESFDY